MPSKRSNANDKLALLYSVVLGGLIVCSGCQSSLRDRAERMQRGYVYYLDGAGGGGITNWAEGVRRGLLNAGYDGSGEMFSWQTGLGVLADQKASNEYKRMKAKQLANKMVAYRQQHPETPITMIGLSAGTAIAVFTLEALPNDFSVGNVMLLSGSLSATYDLTPALRRVRGKLYVTTSQRDLILGDVVRMTGTADRDSGTTDTVGVEGPRLPRDSSAESRQLYSAKLVVVPWKSEFARYGNLGGHTDTVSSGFIERYVAPLVETRSGVQFAATAPTSRELVENPDYKRWSAFPVGSWVEFSGRETVDGQTYPFRLKSTLVKKTPTVLVLRREQINGAPDAGSFMLNQTLYESALIAAEENPLTHPASRVFPSGNTSIQIGRASLDCQVKTIASSADYSDWGNNPRATVYSSDRVPGGIVQIDLATRFDNKEYQFKGKVEEFRSTAK